MGGTASVAKNQAASKQIPSGSAAKYEDKSLPKTNTDTKVDGKPEDKQQISTNDAGSVDTQLLADPKQSAEIKVDNVEATDSKLESEMKDVDVTSNADVSKTAQVTTGTVSPLENVPSTKSSEITSQPKENDLIRNDHSCSQIGLFTVGDFVKINNSDGTISEGLLMEVLDDQKVIVDIGSEGIIKQVFAADCELIVKYDELEVGDQVQIQPNGSSMYYVGKISTINIDGTYDILMEGDDPDDIETNVKIEHIRKLMSRRAIIVARWKRAALVVSSMNNFASFALDSNQFNPSTRASGPAASLATVIRQQGINRNSVKEVHNEDEITPTAET